MKISKKISAIVVAVCSVLICGSSFAGTPTVRGKRVLTQDAGQIVPVRALLAIAPLASTPTRLGNGGGTLQLNTDIIGAKESLKKAYLKRTTLPGGVKVRGLFHTTWGELHVTFSRGDRWQIVVFKPYGETLIVQYRGQFRRR